MTELMSWKTACDVVSKFFVDVDEKLNPFALGAAIEAAPGVVDASLAMFRHAFTDVGESEFDPEDQNNQHWLTLAGYAVAYAPSAGQRLLDEVVFDVHSPPLYRFLAEYIHASIPADTLVAAIVKHLRGDDERRAINALAMQYYLFGRSDDPRLSPAALAAISAAVDALRARPGASPELAAQLAQYEKLSA